MYELLCSLCWSFHFLYEEIPFSPCLFGGHGIFWADMVQKEESKKYASALSGGYQGGSFLCDNAQTNHWSSRPVELSVSCRPELGWGAAAAIDKEGVG